MAELDGLVDLPALDQIRVRLKDRVEFFRCRNLFSVQNPAAGLIDDTIAQRTIIGEVFAQFFEGEHVGWSFSARLRRRLQRAPCIGQDLLSESQQLSVCGGLLIFTLCSRHAGASAFVCAPRACGLQSEARLWERYRVDVRSGG